VRENNQRGARRRGFPPVIDEHVEVLVLGSFPSPASLVKKQYYGHPQNHFWKLMGALLDEPLYEMEYSSRLKTLLKHGIGLWDVLHQCERAGALDSNIRNAVHNDFQKVAKIARGLKRVCFNGKTAGRFEPVFAASGYETLVLPSSSPAYTLAFDAKLKIWRRIVEIFAQGGNTQPAQRSRLSDNRANAGDACSGEDDGAGGNGGSGGRRARRTPARGDTPELRGTRPAATY